MAKKQKSRTQRWADAVNAVREEFDRIVQAGDDLVGKIDDLKSIQEEYQEWMDNLPENLGGSALAEKLQVVTSIDLDTLQDDPIRNLGEVEQMLDEAEGAELPMGFGRD